ncbi:MAG TPA: fumarylacetoacetate hydrolase family protein [Conexibacter sp.]|nr:fumarylacetoacetate hydrolase family protein [Conexibacter sp.]
MILARFIAPGSTATAIGVVADGTVTPLRGSEPAGAAALGVVPLLHAPPAAGELADVRYALAEVQLLTPVPQPSKIIGVGLNYGLHAQETGVDAPEYPELFAKLANALSGPGSPIEVADPQDGVDYEGELVAIVARRVHGELTPQQALAAIGGYTIANDVSARSWQFRGSQWMLGKSFDGYCPVGPWAVTADAVPDVQDLRICTRLNGAVVQEASTAEMLFTVAEIVRYVAQVATLEPGDLILTGTPDGVGIAQKPPRYLTPGDVVEVEIERIGKLVNEVVGAG